MLRRVVLAWLALAGAACSPDQSSPTRISRPIGGPADEPLERHLPDWPFVAPSTEDPQYNPYLGLVVSSRYLLVSFREGTTVGEANEALALADASVVGTLPEAGIVQLALDASDPVRLSETADALQEHPSVEAALEDLPFGPRRVPRPSPEQAAFDWRWGAPSGANWNLELVRAPLAWNLVDHIRARGEPPPVVGVIEEGFMRHVDLQNLVLPAERGRVRDHGAGVAAIIGATFDNRSYLDGIAPHVRMIGAIPERSGSDAFLFAEVLEAVVRGFGRADPRPRVVNLSMGPNFPMSLLGGDFEEYVTCDPRPNADWWEICWPARLRDRLHRGALLFAKAILAVNETGEMLIIAAAGNDSKPNAVYPSFLDSPIGYAAASEYANPDAKRHIIVVESLKPGVSESWDAARADHSNIDGGGVFAPGVDIFVPRADFLQAEFGNSYATPHVTGAAALLLSIEPTLSNAELRRLLTELPFAAPQDGGASRTSTRLDLYGAVLGIDQLRPNRRPSVLAALCDFDDGTEDGFEKGDVVGDGRVDLSDFRRLRDSFLLAQGHDLELGEADARRDLNMDGTVEAPEREAYARVVLNGNWRISDMPQLVGDELELDVDIFDEAYRLYEDTLPRWTEDALSDLLWSADLRVRAEKALSDLGATELRVELGGGGGPVPDDLSPLRDIPVRSAETILTTPLRGGPWIRWSPVDGNESCEWVQAISPDLSPGEDREVVLDGEVPVQVRAPATGSAQRSTCNPEGCGCGYCNGTVEVSLDPEASPEVAACFADPDNCPVTFEWTCDFNPGSLPPGFGSTCGASFSAENGARNQTLGPTTLSYGVFDNGLCWRAPFQVELIARVRARGCPSTVSEAKIVVTCNDKPR